MDKRKVAIIGAGLVGSLLAIYLQRRGYAVRVYERRPDLRLANISAGRSINLALSNRGWRPLVEVGLEDELKKLIIPMRGRMMHDLQGELSFQPYGQEGQAINSISRGGLNGLLMSAAEKIGAKFHFLHKCLEINLESTIATMEVEGAPFEVECDYIIGADGAFSEVRRSMLKKDRFNFTQDYLPHGYKELSIPPTKTGDFALEKNALHIWPRKDFMLIALPNLDKSFTVTLFLPFEGSNSFENLVTEKQINAFFATEFADAKKLMPGLLDDFKSNPASSLVTIRSFPWVQNNTCLIGDAAHAIVPFYGQGMISGFEDCYVFNRLLGKHDDNWPKVLKLFEEQRKPDTDAIAHLALDNFVVMRDRVSDKSFLLRKKIEAHLHKLFPDRWIPLYSMVTFSPHIRYSEALAIGQKQAKIMDEVMAKLTHESDWTTLDFEGIVAKLKG